MKNLIVILLMLVAGIVSAQKVVTITPDTVQGAETIYLVSDEITKGWQTCTIQALCTQTGGTTDGTMSLQGSVDGTSYVPVSDATGLVKGYPSDSLTMTNGAVQLWILEKSPFNYFRLKVEGTASDSTLITPKYSLKK